MSRLEKKCLLASAGMHALLLGLLVFGTAFIVPTSKRPLDLPAVKVVPTRLIDEALAGGGGNPNLPPSDAMQKGNTLQPQPPQPPPPQPTPQPQPKPAPPPPLPEPRKPEARKPEPAPKALPKPTKDVPKESAKPPAKSGKSDSALIPLKPVVRSAADKEAARAEAEAREWAATSQRVGRQIGRAVENLRAGFEQGTVVEASGPGGEAYMNYAAWVKQVYEDAWRVPDNLMDEEGTVRVIVTIHRSGNVISAYIDRRSGNSALDRSVERALSRVKSIGQPFPAGAREDTRSFTINFNLKAKRLTG